MFKFPAGGIDDSFSVGQGIVRPKQRRTRICESVLRSNARQRRPITTLGPRDDLWTRRPDGSTALGRAVRGLAVGLTWRARCFLIQRWTLISN